MLMAPHPRAKEMADGLMSIKDILLVGFFLAGLVIHGGLQGWWIAPVLGSLKELPLMIGATLLTAFNDNAAITYLSSLVPSFSPALKYAVVAGAVTGGVVTHPLIEVMTPIATAATAEAETQRDMRARPPRRPDNLLGIIRMCLTG